jgi:hypothetical protein
MLHVNTLLVEYFSWLRIFSLKEMALGSFSHRDTLESQAKPHTSSAQVVVTKMIRSKKSKAIPVTGLGGLWGCEMLRIPHCLDNRLTDGGKVISPTHPPQFTTQ